MDKSKLIIIGIWVFAILLMAIGFSSVSKKPPAIDQNSLSGAEIKFDIPDLKFRKMTKDEYQQIEQYLKKNYPEAKIVSSSKDIMINFPKIESYYEWWAALHSTSNINTSARWKMEAMCVGVKCKGDPLSAVLSARVLEMKMDNPAPKKVQKEKKKAVKKSKKPSPKDSPLPPKQTKKKHKKPAPAPGH